MFDWLFGSKRQTNYDDTNALYSQFNDASTKASDFYNKNIADQNWDGLDSQKRADLIGQFNTLNSQATGLADQYQGTNEAYNQENEEYKNAYFGNGLLGSLLNPLAQTADAGIDLATGHYEGRDAMSDLGALGESALTFLPLAGGAMKAMKLGKAGNALNKGINSIPGWAGMGAGFSGLEELRQGGEDTQLQDVLKSAGTGAAFGAALPLGGKLLKKRGSSVLGKQMAGRGMEQDAINQTMGAIPNRALYQTALKSFIPKSTIGKIGVGGGALMGANALMGGSPQPVQQPVGGQGEMSEQELVNYLISQGMI